MTKYKCPICGKRVCDSLKNISLAKLSPNNEPQADIVIKCQCCKNTLAVNVNQETVITDNSVLYGRPNPQI